MKTEICDSLLLLKYVARAGLKVEQSDASLLLDLQEKIDGSGKLSAADETSFWIAYSRLCDLAKPVTVESLKAISDTKGSWWNQPLAQRTIRNYTALAVYTFFILVAVQIYWLIGSGLTQAIQSTQTDLQNYVAESYEEQGSLSMASLHNGGWAAGASVVGAATPPPLLDGYAISKKKDEELRENISRTLAILVGYYEALSGWARVWEFLVTPDTVFSQRKQLSPIVNSAPTSPGAVRLVSLSVPGQLVIAKTQAEASFALQAIQQFLLPFLYGLLGTLIFVLRSLGSEFKQITYTASMNYGYRLRVIIGALSGVAVAWFLQTKSISALALAFLAGYSVEVLFSAMDRLVKALSDGTSIATPEKPHS
jgi:hypothetical protein